LYKPPPHHTRASSSSSVRIKPPGSWLPQCNVPLMKNLAAPVTLARKSCLSSLIHREPAAAPPKIAMAALGGGLLTYQMQRLYDCFDTGKRREDIPSIWQRGYPLPREAPGAATLTRRFSTFQRYRYAQMTLVSQCRCRRDRRPRFLPFSSALSHFRMRARFDETCSLLNVACPEAPEQRDRCARN
jgi:hypothetical protein